LNTPARGGNPVLEVHGLTRRFGGLTAVDSLDFRVDEREILGLIGPNGSGKTTTLHLLTGFMRPTSGRVVFRDEEITGQAPSRIARQGMVRTFQLTNVFGSYSTLDNVRHAQHLTARDSVLGSLLMLPGYRRERARLSQRARELLGFVGFIPARMQVPAASLSAGEQRRLEIAVALGSDPRLVLLDEPASGLTAEETTELTEVLGTLRDRGVTTVLVEHNMRMVLATCNRIVVLNFGKKIADGSPSEISREPAVVAAYLGSRRDA
jgi:branched-chain amino acid transport system ATP-binding protein